MSNLPKGPDGVEYEYLISNYVLTGNIESQTSLLYNEQSYVNNSSAPTWITCKICCMYMSVDQDQYKYLIQANMCQTDFVPEFQCWKCSENKTLVNEIFQLKS